MKKLTFLTFSNSNTTIQIKKWIEEVSGKIIFLQNQQSFLNGIDNC